MIEYLTKEEIENRALQGEVFALDVSSEHWEQLVDSDLDELLNAILDGKVDVYADSCGCCIFNADDCDDCIIRKTCNEFYLRAHSAFERFAKTGSEKEFNRFKKYAKLLLKGINEQLVNYKSR